MPKINIYYECEYCKRGYEEIMLVNDFPTSVGKPPEWIIWYEESKSFLICNTCLEEIALAQKTVRDNTIKSIKERSGATKDSPSS